MWTTNYCCFASSVTFHHKKKRHSLAVTCLKHEKHTIWIIFPDDNLCVLLNICMFVYGLLWQISQWKWNALNHFNFPFDWRNQNIFGFFVPCFDVKTFGYLWKNYMGTAFFWNQLIMKVISVIRFVSWIFLLFDLSPSFQSLQSRSTH